jgi:uncharacterized protein YggE
MLTVALVTFAACQSSDANDDDAQSPAVSSAETSGDESAMSGGVSTVQLVSGSQGGGIFVSGTGSVSVSPDTAILSLGVQARGDTVAEARSDAAEAMTAIVDVLRSQEVEQNDIRTRSLRINPVYDYWEDRPELTGFEVANNVSVIVRDLDSVGDIIDGVAGAGGDHTRIHDINFTIDDPSPFQAELREKAVADATAKAQHLATLAGVTLGPAIAIREGGRAAPIPQGVFTDSAMTMEEATAFDTPISAGQTELRLTVSMAFAIE